MTPDGFEKTIELDPALQQRFSEGEYKFKVPELKAEEAVELVRHRLSAVRTNGKDEQNSLFPFPEDFVKALKPSNYSNARRLIKICFHVLNEAKKSNAPFSHQFLREVEAKAYPSPNDED